jgi:hypothetical protein
VRLAGRLLPTVWNKVLFPSSRLKHSKSHEDGTHTLSRNVGNNKTTYQRRSTSHKGEDLNCTAV